VLYYFDVHDHIYSIKTHSFLTIVLTISSNYGIFARIVFMKNVLKSPGNQNGPFLFYGILQ